jgi:hypothetical protein
VKFELGGYAASPDDDVFVHLAKLYVHFNPTLKDTCDSDYEILHDGITNGAAWYPVYGTQSLSPSAALTPSPL